MIDRRAFACGAALAPLAINGRAFSQSAWPDRVIRIIVPFAAGAFTDVSARLLATDPARTGNRGPQSTRSLHAACLPCVVGVGRCLA